MPKRYKVLITGSNGMLGTDLWQELNGDYEILGLDISGSRVKGQGSRVNVVDITDKDKIRSLIYKIKPDIVLHTAAWTDVDGCELNREKAYEINYGGTENIARACKDADADLIYISTDFVFDGKKKSPYKETDLPNPLNVYAQTKLKGEEAVKNLVKKYFILRTSWLYGSNGKNFVDTILQIAEKKKVLKVVDDQIGSPTYAKDLAKAIHLLLDKAFVRSAERGVRSYGVYHVTNDGSVSWYEYAKEILKLSGSKTKVIPISSEELNRPAKRPAMSVLDNSKFKKFCDYRMRSWKDALREYLIEGKQSLN
ncbi:MAG: dTDP-4-dehydrorhamnose reductase [Omnitrophica bacterium RIFCSPLOWO2_01_FULL_45_10]|nr:MAG: dTDP-4-dehydrorhamnose reductase [Omnitrophica bacterium RIFCSPLOWO2_01_FULL_45_10]